jgi:hypothetical protein
MDLIEEYLRAVALLLPKEQRDDIVAELRDTILTRVEAREAELGRKLTPDETEAVLREIGHPLVIAARYREGPQSLVGPALYPYWAFAVKAAASMLAVVAVISFLARLVGTGDFAFALGSALTSAIGGLVSVVGLATIVAWIVERRGVSIRYLETWHVKDLKGLEVLSWNFDKLREHFGPPNDPAGRTGPSAPRPAWTRPVPPHGPRPPRVDRALGAMVVGALIVFWWIGLIPFGLVSSPAQVREIGFDPGPFAAVNWNEFRTLLFWPVLAYASALILQGVIIWTLPGAVRLQGLVNLAISVLVLVGVAWIWNVSPISSSLHVNSLADLVLQLKAAMHEPPPWPIAPFVALVLALVAFGALCRALQGLFQIAFGWPPHRHAMAI